MDDRGQSVHIGDFRAQTRRTYENITKLLNAEGATWKDIVRTTCYLRDIERDYEAFNEERTQFFKEQGLESPARLHGNPGDSVPPGIADRNGSHGDLRFRPRQAGRGRRRGGVGKEAISGRRPISVVDAASGHANSRPLSGA